MKKAFVAMGYDDDTASWYAAFVGDTPRVDGDELLVRREGGKGEKIFDRISYSEFKKKLAKVEAD